MNSKILLSLVGGVVVVVAGAYFVISSYVQKVEEAEYKKDDTVNIPRVTEGAFAPPFEYKKKKDIAEIEQEIKTYVGPPSQ